MKVGDAFSGDFLKTSDLKGRAFKLTISSYKMEKLDDGEKPGLSFDETSKVLVLNKTNANRIVEALGTDEMDEWVGKKIEIMPDHTEFKGERVECIRVRIPEGPPPPLAEDGDDIPF
jgi:hypothetical protein